MTQTAELQRSPLHKYHVEHGGKMVNFAGWELPMFYKRPDGSGSIREEHIHVRTHGGLFDVSHMGRLSIKGRHAQRFLERVCSRKIYSMEPKQCRYTLLCNEQGGVRDDALVYRLADDEFTVVCNGANREKIVSHFEANKGDMIVEIEDRTLKTAMAAMQGPKVADLFSNYSKEIPSLKRYRFAVKNLVIIKLIVSRTGYTGEDGFEIILPAGSVEMVFKMIMGRIDPFADESPIRPIGLGARDTLRMEAGMPLYGHELTEDINALESGLGFAINLDKGDDERAGPFVGMEVLRQIRESGGPTRSLKGLMIDGKRTARQGMSVMAGETTVGVVTSACVSPTLGQPIAIAYLDNEHASPGTALTIDTGRGDRMECQVRDLPFYTAPKK